MTIASYAADSGSGASCNTTAAQESWFIHRKFQVKDRIQSGTEDTLEQAKAAFKAALGET